MNTRSAKRKDLHSKSNSTQLEQSRSKARNSTSSNTENEENIESSQFEKLVPSPVFNIHIHVPYYDTENSKLFLPKIQPVINLHFDELARKLEKNKNIQSEKSLYKTFHDLLAKISPQFGVVKIHINNNSEDKDIQESNINVTPNSSQRPNNDKRLKVNMNSKKSHKLDGETSETIKQLISSGQKKTCRSKSNNFKSHSLISYELDKDIKLKKAVVLLTDICKTKDYKHLFESNSYFENQNNEIGSSCNFADKLENNSSNEQKFEEGLFSIKAENESRTLRSFSEENAKNIVISENHFRDSDINLHAEKDIDNKPNIEKISNGKDQNFTALVEGWSFSDILNRFQLKHSEKFGNSIASSSSIIENRNNNDEMDDDNNKLSLELDKKIEKTEYREEDFVEEFDSDNKFHLGINKNEINVNEKDCHDENVSDSDGSFSFLQYENETVNDFFWSESDALSADSVHEFNSIKKKKLKLEFTSDSNDLGSDKCEIISGKEVSTSDIVDMEVIEHDLSSIKSGDIQENKFEVPETNKSSVLNVTDPCFHLELIKKEMQRRALSSTPVKKKQKNQNSKIQKLKSKVSDIEPSSSENSSLPKKMKLSNMKSKISEEKTKSSLGENFIRLTSSGPTKFSVTSLNKIKPSTSDAKNFKEKMLFGNRVNRFSSPDQLRIYQLKKEASRKSMNH